jgi:hypothetical protein
MNKVIVGIVVAAFAAALTWNFAAVAEMPEKYVTKVENTDEHKEIRQDLKEIKDLIIKLHIDKGE